MNKREKIKNILDKAFLDIVEVLDQETISNLKNTSERLSELIDNINDQPQDEYFKLRFGFTQYLSDDNIEKLFESCKKWVQSGTYSEDDEYYKFCHSIASIEGTDLKEEMKNNIRVVVFRYNAINVKK